ncbi:hypothetical protein [Methylobacterium sp. Leaf125]|uniref:hypothetical protein n=1 Tax=Methylobacterium sp. Leaf125 TaxID=1736265 RepID=UPI0012E0E493|nr:hypothetical protein [Methylobacterium sp. Leaf125]
MIEKARKAGAFGSIVFESPVWSVDLVKTKRASSGRAQVHKLYFTESKAGSRSEEDRQPLREPFGAFLKAIVRLREDAAPKHLDDHATLLRAGRYLHAEMESIGYDPCLLLPDHFDAAARASVKADAGSTAYALGKKLVEIADWINRYNTARVRIDFRNPNPRIDDTNARIGKDADARRAAKLPSDAALDALAEIANLVTEDVDVLRMRTIELLVCGGWRINELLSIPADCEVEEAAYENGKPVLGADGQPVVHYGIRYYGEKGAPPLPKWIPTPLVDVARRAVADIRRITQPTRDAVIWMAANPGRIMVPGFIDADLETMMPPQEVGAALGFAGRSAGLQWCRTWNIPLHGTKAILVRRRDVAAAIRAEIPSPPADIPLELSEYMFLTPANFTHADRATIPGSVRFVTDGMIASFIGGHSETRSVFDRFGKSDAGGQPIRMNSHQFRHWLNTLAQHGGMNQLEIARWSGRKDVSQNAAYDHVSGAQLASRLRDLVEAGQIKGPLAQAHARLAPRDRSRFLEAQIATAHVTDIGLCIHDWSLAPCANHGACADCGEHVVLKGDERQREAAVRLLDETKFLLGRAEEEAADETYGAARWVESQRRVVSGLERIVAVHSDVAVPEGTLVHVPPAPVA